MRLEPTIQVQHKNLGIRILLGTVAVGVLLPILGIYIIHNAWPTFTLDSLAFHSSLEIAGSVLGLVLAASFVSSNQESNSKRLFISLALISMAILDVFHSWVPEGNSFVWLHTMAGLFGGLFFAGVCLPQWKVSAQNTKLTAAFVLVLSVLFGAYSIIFEESIPAMIVNGQFTQLANTLNMAAGILTIIAAVSFAVAYKKHHHQNDLIFLLLCVFFGLAGLLFITSDAWDGQWWYWHVLRLIGYMLAFTVVMIGLRRAEDDLATLNAELNVSNARLHQENEAHAKLAAELRITNNELIKAELEIKSLNANLEKQIEKRTAELQAANKELEAFSYSVSHDLRAPLRALQGFSNNVYEKYGDQLDDTGKRWLMFIKTNAGRMDSLISDILSFSRLSRAELKKESIDMVDIVNRMVAQEKLVCKLPVSVKVGQLPNAWGDETLLGVVWQNLIGNAFKYSDKKEEVQIEISGFEDEQFCHYTITDHGAGFDMQHADKLFVIFQRLHGSDEFEGTGIGLANVNRVIQRHGGEIAATGTVDVGATFNFSIAKEV